ncbi:MAG: IS4 family transposase [Bacteroidota bacterium]
MGTLPEGQLSTHGFHPYRSLGDTPFYYGDFYGDSRLSKRLASLKAQVYTRQSLVINQLSSDSAEQKAWYRLLKHKNLQIPKMIYEMINQSQAWQESEHILLVEDTRLINYTSLRKRVREAKGLGSTGNYGDKYFGYLMHPTLAIDAQRNFPVGISDLQLWHKAEEIKRYNDRKGESIPIEKKSSFRWIDGALQSAKRIGSSAQLTVVADREADIYEAICQWKAAGLDMVIRSQHDRNISESTGKLRAFLDEQPIAGECEVDIRSDLSGKARKVHFALQYGAITLKRTPKAHSSGILQYPPTIPIYALQAVEVGREKPIRWILLSSHPIDSPKDALKVIQWYKQRWHIEQLFRLLKSQGLQLDQLDHEYGEAIVRMGVIAIEAAFRILQLNLSMKTEKQLPAKWVFTPLQIKFLKILCKKYEGTTQRLQNPYSKEQLQWAAWIIARIGGWKAGKPKVRPGPITFKRGWERFSEMSSGINIFLAGTDMEGS